MSGDDCRVSGGGAVVLGPQCGEMNGGVLKLQRHDQDT